MDYRKLSNVTKKYLFPLTRIDETLDTLLIFDPGPEVLLESDPAAQQRREDSVFHRSRAMANQGCAIRPMQHSNSEWSAFCGAVLKKPARCTWMILSLSVARYRNSPEGVPKAPRSPSQAYARKAPTISEGGTEQNICVISGRSDYRPREAEGCATVAAGIVKPLTLITEGKWTCQ
jgi:hypothetical protein